MMNTLKNIHLWEFCSQFENKMTAGFTDRRFGYGTAPFDSFNLGLHCLDNPDTVIENRKQMCHSLNTDISCFTCSTQIHGTDAFLYEFHNAGEGSEPGKPIHKADILLTRTPGLLLNIFTADCFPVFLYDPVINGAALVHAGWRGIASRIVSKSIDIMKRTWNSRPEQLLAGIGPGIGICCFETENETAQKLKSVYSGNSAFIKDGKKYRISLSDIIIEHLLHEGIDSEKIEKKSPCTSCDPRFFSYRKEKGITGRMGAFFVAR